MGGAGWTLRGSVDMPRFAKGNPPGPGRPPGSRNKSMIWFDALADEGTEKVIRVVSEKAEKGNLPAVETAGGLVQAQAAVIAAMARGELTPDEAAAVASVLETQRRALETHDHERRLAELEGQAGKADER